MRTWWKICTVVLVLAVAWMPAAFAADDVSNTRHDFTSAGTAPFNLAGDECVTCHIPHGSSAGRLLWNHTLSGNALTFGVSATTASGTDLPTAVENAPGTSVFCLSCHDGSVAVGDVTVGTDWGTDNVTGSRVVAPSGNLAGNHPIEIPFPDQASATYNSITTAADPAGYVAAPSGVKLFGTTAGQKGIGCASCHNPHDATNTPFLRVAAASLCASCHIK